MTQYTVANSLRTFIVHYDETKPDDIFWWSDGLGAGKAFVEDRKLVICGYNVYGAAFHYGDDHPEVVSEMVV